MVFAAKRRGRVCSGAALAVLVALVALALFSCVDAQSIIGRADKLRDRVESVVAVLCDSSEVDCGRNDLRRSVLKLALRKNFEDGFRLRGRRKLAQFDVQRVLGRADRLRESVGSALESLRSEMAVEEDLGSAADAAVSELESVAERVVSTCSFLFSTCEFGERDCTPRQEEANGLCARFVFGR